MAQRVMQYQTAIQLAQGAPQLYDMGKLHRQMLEVLGIKDATDIVKLPDDIKPHDPVTENMMMLKQEPVQAFKYQDHEAHITVHMSAMEDPKLQQIVGQSPFASSIQSSMAAHITEHVAFQYRKEIEKQLGVALPDEDKPLPDDVEEELSRLAAKAAEKLLKKDQAEVAQEEAMKQQEDPLTQIQQRELTIKEKELDHKIEIDKAKLSLEANELKVKENIENAKIGVKVATQLEENEREDLREGTKIGIELGKEIIKDESSN